MHIEYISHPNHPGHPGHTKLTAAIHLLAATLLLTTTAATGHLRAAEAGVSEETLLFADTFDRTAAAATGTTSTGGYSWIEQENANFAFWITSNKLVLNGGGGESNPSSKNGNIYVNYDLDAVANYRIDMDLAVGVGSGIKSVAKDRWIMITPRADTSSDKFTSSGWLFITNSSDNIQVSFWDASTQTTKPVGLPGLATGTEAALSIVVNNNTATLTYGLITDTRTLNYSANDGKADYLKFNLQDFGGATVDNLAVTAIPASIPEPRTTAALFAGAATLLATLGLCRRRHR
ncbi:MAG: PEP-CTERM sorting domain-containing protein [Opitutaceae bacterium]|jgi:hypothetical protein|nr:PEP-CTERM sorting domain-containing protein [Opitutaceae bacterium]